MQKVYAELLKEYDKEKLIKYNDYDKTYFKIEIPINKNDFIIKILYSPSWDDFTWRNYIRIVTNKNHCCATWCINNTNYTKLIELCKKIEMEYKRMEKSSV